MCGSTVAFITKHCELLQCFQDDFFSFFGVYFVIFFKNYLCRFFLNIELIKNLTL